MPVYSTLDLLNAMLSSNAISEEDFLEFRTRLRRAGYFFVPVNEEELEHHLKVSVINDGKVIETAELKAIRESVLRVRMSDWLQLPKDAPWLDTTLKAYIGVLKGLWVDGADIDEVKIRSNWIVDQVDVQGWAHCFISEDADNLVRIGRGAHILALLTPPADTKQRIADAYWAWLEEKILGPIKEQFPDVYRWLVDWYRKKLSELAEAAVAEGEMS